MEKRNISKEELSHDLKDYFDKVELLTDDDIQDMNFYEASLYLEKLNKLDNISKGDKNE